MMKWNKTGGEKLLSIWWAFVIIVIGGGVALSVWIYYGADVDINKINADILAERIIKCITDNSELKWDFLNENQIYSKCSLDEDTFGEGGLYFRISVSSENEELKNIQGGDYSYEKDCQISLRGKGKNYPQCVEKIVYVFYKEENLKLDILTGVKQEAVKGGVV